MDAMTQEQMKKSYQNTQQELSTPAGHVVKQKSAGTTILSAKMKKPLIVPHMPIRAVLLQHTHAR